MCVPEVSILTGEDGLLGLADDEATKAAEIDREHALFGVDGMERKEVGTYVGGRNMVPDQHQW